MRGDLLPGSFFGPATLVELLRHRAERQPDDVAFTFLVDGEDEQVHVTNRQLDRQAKAIGAWLETHDLVGERALLLYPAGLEFIAAFFGCLYAGVTAVPVYPPRRNRSLDRIQAIADDAHAKVALTTDLVMNRVEPLIDETPHLKQLTWLATCHVPEDMDQKWVMPDVHGDTMAFLQYTSGSTGAPKGVMLSHSSLMHNSALIAYSFEHTRSGAGVFWLPSYHDMGLIGGILQPLYCGRPNILMSPMSFLQKPYRWLSAISRFHGSTSGGPNFAYELCVRKITDEQLKTLDLSSWLVAFNGAEPVRAETIDQFCEKFEPCGFRREAFYPCYGMAEAALIVSGGWAKEPPLIQSYNATALGLGRAQRVDPDDLTARALVGCGKTMQDQEILVVDPEAKTTCADNQVGEIWVRGPSIAQGYWQEPELTKEMFHARTKDTDKGPFLRTGDLGFLEEGELFVTGRIKDLLIIRGVNHYPQDIERTIQRAHARLRRDCGGVFTVEVDGRERLVVVQEIERHKQGDWGKVFDAIRRDVSSGHDLAVDNIVLIKAGSIPKTSSGKIQRHACRSGLLDGSLEVVAQWQYTGQASPLPKVAKRPSPQKTVSKPPGAESPEARTAEAKVAAQPEPAVTGNGRKPSPADRQKTIELVMEEVRRVAKERAAGLTPDTRITELGMDSLERMEILASLEEHFGGRFPEEILIDLITCHDVVEAVEQYLGGAVRPKHALAAGEEIPASYHRIDQFPEYVQLKNNLDMLAATGLGDPYFTVHQGLTNDRTLIDGREFINFSSYNYVGMSGDPAVVQAAKDAAEKYGTSVSASRLVSGEKDLHGELERTIAQFLHTEDAVVFVGGHSTNETVIGHLMGPSDLILHDALSHNSIVQGSILSGARRRPFTHNDWQAADELLRQYRHEYRRVLIVIEGVYSMDGDIPDLPAFVDIRRRHKAMLMIDEAHSIGTMGDTGRGLAEHFGVAREDVDIWMGTISKALGSGGGFIAAAEGLVRYLKYTAPGFVFATGISPANTAAALAALRLLEENPQRVAQLRDRSALFLRLCQEHGLNTGYSGATPVVPVILGNSQHCLELSKALFDRGVNAKPILHPAVEENAARVRFFITALHTEEQIHYTVDTLVAELAKIDPGYVTEIGSVGRVCEPSA